MKWLRTDVVDIHQELTEREPNEDDNPYDVIQHILDCRVHAPDLHQEWHEEYINRVLFGLHSGKLNRLLGIETGDGGGGHIKEWKQRVRDTELVLNVEELERKVDEHGQKIHVLNGTDKQDCHLIVHYGTAPAFVDLFLQD